jgi:hypothetical protein
MKQFIALSALLVAASPAFAQYYNYGTGSNPENHSVSGYVNNHGSYVEPHHQTNPNGTTLDNYETRGNYNPYTGSYGRR